MRRLFLLLSLLSAALLSVPAYSQCMTLPVSLPDRARNAPHIVMGHVQEAHAFLAPDGNIYTAYRIGIQAWLHGYMLDPEIVVIGMGGILGDKAQVTTPSLHLEAGPEYVLFLEAPQTAIADPSLPAGMKQCFAYADVQGAIPGRDGWYYDVHSAPQREDSLFSRIRQYAAATAALTPDGQWYVPRTGGVPVRAFGPLATISGFSPQTVNSGTIASGDRLTITGSGFGTSAATIAFKNADDGGSSTTTVSLASDIISWSDGKIVVKVPSRAGTGTFSVNGASSPSALTVGYAHTSINSDFSGFGAETRQRYVLRNKNGSGGYSFVFNTNFSQNAQAVAAIQRALETWRCETGINWQASGSTSTTFADDGTNVILFDVSLPAGVLGRTTSRFSASANGSCAQQNTVWWLNEVDVQFRPSPSGNQTWEFGPALPASNEYDFESVAVHELGHAHGLGHRIAPNEVMHFSLSNGKITRTPALTEFAGAREKVSYSTGNTCFNPTNSGTPHVAFNTANCLTAMESAPALPAWQVVSPVREVLTLYPPQSRPYQVALVDLQGRTVLAHPVPGGDLRLSVGHLPAGIYLCRIFPEGEEPVAVKVVIQ